MSDPRESVPKALLDNVLDGEQIYPIYRVSAKWSVDIGDRKTTMPTDGLPKGRMWNHNGWYEMPKRVATIESIIEKTVEDWWPGYQKKQKGNLDDLSVSVEFIRWEVWCPGWFSHWTHDLDLDDGKVLLSFSRYVERAQRNGFPESLMGADDRYRWSGRTLGKGDDDEQTDPPCRCPCCKDRGVITIGH
jgi:hypothetical protein